jgi:UDP-glucose 4-epimerase
MHYLVTGGAGFIGSHIVDSLVLKGNDVTVLDDFSSGDMKNLSGCRDKIRVVNASVTDKKALFDACRGVDGIFHEAAIASVPFSVKNPEKTHEANLTGTVKVLNAAIENGVKKVVMASSAAVYGNNPSLPKTEEMPAEPLSPYSVQKLSGEYYGTVFSDLYSLDFVALRYFNVFGPRQLPGSSYAAAIPAFISSVISGKRPTVFGDGEQTRDFIFVKDVVSANLKAMQSDVKGVFNVASGKKTSLLQLLDVLGEISGKAIIPEFEPPRAGDVRHSCADISKFSGACGWKPEYSLNEGLAETFEYFRSL